MAPESCASIAALFAERRLRFRDLDAIMVAIGYISYDAVEAYITRQGANRSGDEVEPTAREIVERICGCQYHDHGETRLAAFDQNSVVLEVAGACRHCPQITYTAQILKDALRFRLPGLGSIRVDGIDLQTRSDLPVNAQYTLAQFCKATGLTVEDMDAALLRKPRLTDDDLQALARIALARSRPQEAPPSSPK